MNGVAAKVAQKVGMLLEHDDVDTRTRQQEAEHKAARAAADDTATGRNLFSSHSCALSDRNDGEIADTRRASTAPR
jgi:hypothetical protein